MLLAQVLFLALVGGQGCGCSRDRGGRGPRRGGAAAPRPRGDELRRRPTRLRMARAPVRRAFAPSPASASGPRSPAAPERARSTSVAADWPVIVARRHRRARLFARAPARAPPRRAVRSLRAPLGDRCRSSSSSPARGSGTVRSTCATRIAALPGILLALALVLTSGSRGGSGAGSRLLAAFSIVSIARSCLDPTRLREDVRSAARFLEAHAGPRRTRGWCAARYMDFGLRHYGARDGRRSRRCPSGRSGRRGRGAQPCRHCDRREARVWLVLAREWEDDPSGHLAALAGRRRIARRDAFRGRIFRFGRPHHERPDGARPALGARRHSARNAIALYGGRVQRATSFPARHGAVSRARPRSPAGFGRVALAQSVGLSRSRSSSSTASCFRRRARSRARARG